MGYDGWTGCLGGVARSPDGWGEDGGDGVDGEWRYKEEEQHMVDTSTNKCLALHPESSELVMRECDGNNSYHKWSWRTIKPSWVDNQ